MTTALPPEVLEFLVRTLPSRALWAWLGEKPQEKLKPRVAQGFRATAEVLRQPIARARLVSHLQNAPDDSHALIKIWGENSPKILESVGEKNDALLISALPILQAQHGGEAILLALLHDERDAVLEALADAEEIPVAAPEPQDGSTPDVDVGALQSKLQRAQTKVEQLRTKAHEAKSRASQTEKSLKEKLHAQERAAREAIRSSRQWELRVEVLESKLAEAETARERAERKARSTLAASEEFSSETKTLRRQVHRLQQVNEELRRRLSTLEATQLAASTPAERKAAAPKILSPEIATRVPTPKRERDFLPGLKISLSDLQIAIDRNNEKIVATIAAEMEALRERDAVLASATIRQIRGLGRYYERVLHAAHSRVLVDASNVARHDGPGKGKLRHLKAMRDELRRMEFFPILFVADASLPYHIDDSDEFRRLIKTGEIFVSAPGQEADEILALEARETGAYVVTNDRNFHRHLAPNFTPLRIGFRIEEGVVLLDDF